MPQKQQIAFKNSLSQVRDYLDVEDEEFKDFWYSLNWKEKFELRMMDLSGNQGPIMVVDEAIFGE